VAIEKAVFNEHGSTTAAYKSKIRSFFVNLKDKNNPGLRASVVSGDIAAERFSKMSSQVRFRFVIGKISMIVQQRTQDMASAERKAADEKIKEENLFKTLAAEEQQAETDAFQCGRCKQVSNGNSRLFFFN
jgi:transcription elongation factor S-II